MSMKLLCKWQTTFSKCLSDGTVRRKHNAASISWQYNITTMARILIRMAGINTNGFNIHMVGWNINSIGWNVSAIGWNINTNIWNINTIGWNVNTKNKLPDPVCGRSRLVHHWSRRVVVTSMEKKMSLLLRRQRSMSPRHSRVESLATRLELFLESRAKARCGLFSLSDIHVCPWWWGRVRLGVI